MRANIWAGIYNYDTFFGWSTPNYYCATGNCTWEDYSTLGVCSRCADITSKLEKTCNVMTFPGLNNATGCDVSLPNGFSLSGSGQQLNRVFAASANYDSLVYSNYTAALAHVQTIGRGDDSPLISQSTPMRALECVLFPCVIDFKNSTVYNSPDFAKYGANAVSYDECAERILDNFTLGNGSTTSLSSSQAHGGPEIYGMSANAHKALSGYLKSMFNGFETKDFTYGDPNGTYANNQTRTVKMDTRPVIQSLLALPMRGFCYDIFNNQLNDSISCTMQDTARAMTKVIRDYQFNATSFDQYATIGVTYTMLPTVEVAWLWLVPIGMLWTMCAILTLGTMRKARREGAGGMALNPINLLFANVEDRTDLKMLRRRGGDPKMRRRIWPSR